MKTSTITRIVIVALFVVLLLSAAFFVFSKAIKKPTENSTPATQKDTNEDKTKILTQETVLSYIKTSEKIGPGATRATLYHLNPDFTRSDQKTTSFSGKRLRVLTSDKPGMALVLTRPFDGENTIRSLSVRDGELKTLVTIPPEGPSILDALFFNDSVKIGYTTGPVETKGEGWAFHVKDLTTGKTKKIELPEPRLYAGYSILAYSQNDKVVYLKSIGGDAGAMWQSYYKVNLSSGEVTKLGEASGVYSFGLKIVNKHSGEPAGLFSPDATKSAFIQNTTEYDRSYFSDLNANTGNISCLTSEAYRNNAGGYKDEGGAIFIRDVSTGKTREIYRNLTQSDNLCRHYLRQIESLYWIDNETLAFSTLNGIFKINIESEKVEPLYMFPRPASLFSVNRPRIIFVRDGILALSDTSFVSLETGKRLFLNTTNPIEVATERRPEKMNSVLVSYEIIFY